MPSADYTRKQFDPGQFTQAQNQAYSVLAAICGPEVAMAFARYYGKNVSPDEVVNMARDYGLWTAQSGMRGPQAQKALLDRLGIPAQFSPEVNQSAIQQAISNGGIAAISTPGHYFTVQGYDPQTGLYDTGNSGTAYQSGNRYLNLAQMAAIGGTPQGQFLLTGGGGANAINATSPTSGPPVGQNQVFRGGNIPPDQLVQMALQRLNGGQATTNQTNQGAGGNRLDYNNKEQVKQYIRFAAAQRGIDPETAVRVAESEGLNTYVGDNNSSFGPFQLHYGNVAGGGNAVGGMGDAFTRATGLDARDPNTLKEQIDYSLENAKSSGWGPWHGAAAAGVGNRAGIGTYSGNPTEFGDFSTLSSAPAARQGGLPNQQPQQMRTGLPNLVANTTAFSPRAQTGLPGLSAYGGAPTVQMGDTFMTPFGSMSGGTNPTINPPTVQTANWLR